MPCPNPQPPAPHAHAAWVAARVCWGLRCRAEAYSGALAAQRPLRGSALLPLRGFSSQRAAEHPPLALPAPVAAAPMGARRRLAWQQTRCRPPDSPRRPAAPSARGAIRRRLDCCPTHTRPSAPAAAPEAFPRPAVAAPARVRRPLPRARQTARSTPARPAPPAARKVAGPAARRAPHPRACVAGPVRHTLFRPAPLAAHRIRGRVRACR